MKYIESLRNSIEEMIKENNLFVIGEDIQDPYGGAFKVTRGLSTKYPDNIIATPMSEQGFTSMGIGMAILNQNVIVEIMFGDFITLISDPLINHAAKFHLMYNQSLNLVIRTPSGGYRGYGATHSQSLEKMFLGIPGVQVVAPSILCDPGKLLKSAVFSGVPTLFVENKLDYPLEMMDGQNQLGNFEDSSYNADSLYSVGHCGEAFPMSKAWIEGEIPDWTFITYGGMVSIAMDAAKKLLLQDEIIVEVLGVSNLSNSPHNSDLEDLISTERILIIEEGVLQFGWGSEVGYSLQQKGYRVHRLGAESTFIPSGELSEEQMLVMEEDIIQLVRNEEAHEN